MTDIKFRGLDKQGVWRYGSLVTTNKYVRHMPAQHSKTWIVSSSFGNGGWFNVGRYHWVDPTTVGQFTSFRDTEGMDIYVGDIVVHSDYTSVVVFEDGMFLSKHKCKYHSSGWDQDPLSYWTNEGITVIGNIHQNPKLMD